MKVVWLEQARKQLKKFDKPIKKKILDYMDEVAKLENPKTRGKMLVGNLVGFWRYRVGDYRILCKIKEDQLIITVVEVGHRKEVYNK